MDDLIVRISRTIACYSRLRLLTCLIQQGEQAPSQLSARLHLSQPAVAAHLQRLTAVGLITRRRSGGWSFCDAQSPYPANTLSGQCMTWLRHHLASAGPIRRQASSPPDLCHARIFDAATAFTDVRRLQILRYLLHRPSADLAELSAKLSMSGQATARQTDKLCRRGFLEITNLTDRRCYRIASRFKTSAHAELWSAIRKVWESTGSRT